MSRLPVTYCTNIHPGESWADTLRNLQDHTLAVKAAVRPDAPFPVGLRIPGLASREVDEAEAARFKDWLGEHGLYVATVNGFPYGTFHGRPVKAGVYLPDWRDPARLQYTLRLAALLAHWLPDGMDGSISTVPVAFRQDFDPAQEPLARANILAALEGLERLAQRTGKFIRLSVEPEPGCVVETTPQLVHFFERLTPPRSLRPHLAVCYDCCHQALQYEDPAWSLDLLARNDITIGHVQVSSALHLPCPDLTCLSRFDESVYLHQSVARRTDGSLLRLDDLGPALSLCAACVGDADALASSRPSPNHEGGTTSPASPPRDEAGPGRGAKPAGGFATSNVSSPGPVRPRPWEGTPDPTDHPTTAPSSIESWRVHFHLPVFLAELPECRSTQAFLKEFLPRLPESVPLEVETYTFDVLPEELKTPTVVESIVREIRWVEECRAGCAGCLDAES